MGMNLFSFCFKTTKDMDLVLKSGPWFFDRHMLAPNTFDVNVNSAKISMTRVLFLVQVHGLLYLFRTVNVANLLAKVLLSSLIGTEEKMVNASASGCG